MDMLAGRLAGEFPSTDKGLKLKLIRLEDEVAAPVSDMFWVLLSAAGLVLMIACANVGNLFLAHNISREREFAVRICLGASGARTMSLVMAEALMLALLGGFLGLGIAVWGLDGLRVLASGSVPRLANVGLDTWVIGFAVAASVTTAFLFGLVPALRVVRLDLNTCLRGNLTLHPVARRTNLQSILLISQIALVVVLLAGAALMRQSPVKPARCTAWV
jgi:putative ABC transport system permease protein